MATYIGLAALFLLSLNILTSICIVKELKKRGAEVDFQGIKYRAFANAKAYKEISRKHDGFSGPLYYTFVITSFLFFATLAAGIVFAALE